MVKEKVQPIIQVFVVGRSESSLPLVGLRTAGCTGGAAGWPISTPASHHSIGSSIKTLRKCSPLATAYEATGIFSWSVFQPIFQLPWLASDQEEALITEITGDKECLISMKSCIIDSWRDMNVHHGCSHRWTLSTHTMYPHTYAHPLTTTCMCFFR